MFLQKVLSYLASLSNYLAGIDYSILTRPDILVLIAMIFLAVMRKRGIARAALVVVPTSFAFATVWHKMNAATGNALYPYYFAAFLGMGALMVLYILYLYTLNSQVE